MLMNKLIIRQGYPWLQTLEEHKAPLWKRLLAGLTERISYVVADSIIVTTERDKKRIIEKYGIEEPKIHVIPNYVDTTLFKPDASKRIPNRVLYVGRMAQEKNLIVLLSAINHLDVELIMVGEGELKPHLVTMVSINGITNVTFLRKIENEELVHEYQKADMFILPSQYEGNPKALLEAMACGCIVIGTNVRGIKELIKDEETGFLCPEQSPNSIILTINRALFMIREHHEIADKIREKARNVVVANNSLKETVRREICMLRGLR